MESLSSYARQFLGRMSKPECDFIKGIPPAIAIEQKVSSRNPRSTVGTSTEIYEYLRLLYARVGKTFSPVSGQEVKKHSAEDIVKCMLEYPEGTLDAIKAAIDAAGEVLNKAGVTEEELSDAKTALDNAVRAIKKTQNPQIMDVPVRYQTEVDGVTVQKTLTVRGDAARKGRIPCQR